MEITKAGAVTAREEDGITVELNDESGAPAYIMNGTGAPERVTITVAGTYSKRYRLAQDANRRWWRKQGRRTPSDEAIDTEILKLIAACIIDWHGFTQEGQPYPCTRDNALHVLESMPWVREQVEAASADHEAFFPKASGN